MPCVMLSVCLYICLFVSGLTGDEETAGQNTSSHPHVALPVSYEIILCKSFKCMMR